MLPYTAYDALNAMAHAFKDEIEADANTTNRGAGRGLLPKRLPLSHWLTAVSRRRAPAQANGAG